MILKWLEFQASNLWYVFIVIIVFISIIYIIYYFKFYEQKIYAIFLKIIKKSEVHSKEFEALKEFYSYYKEKVPLRIRKKELINKKLLYI
ncbi:MAG: hypothetical protein KatS3mg129_1225 [Leptospiraceae bacterium]|nr:MAG: hypothetical protein KatS3mg129_1225 [Leptospiraceae bacterium]